jgi:hypothetical protein
MTGIALVCKCGWVGAANDLLSSEELYSHHLEYGCGLHELIYEAAVAMPVDAAALDVMRQEAFHLLQVRRRREFAAPPVAMNYSPFHGMKNVLLIWAGVIVAAVCIWGLTR